MAFSVVNTDVALGVMISIKNLYLHHELEEDFVIEIDNTEIKCHRFILASCSGFFCGLFRSGMKEVKNGRATLQDISCETLKLILEALYTGSDVMTEDNVISIWHASNQLQIDFMIKLCENMAVKMLSLDNFEDVYRNAKLINSSQVLYAIRSFMLEHFVQIRKMNTLLELSYDELLSLVSDDKLVVGSEDQVLETIMKWIEYPDIVILEVEENQNNLRKRTGVNRKKSEVIAQDGVENNEFFNGELTSHLLNDSCTSEIENSIPAVDKGINQPQLCQAEDHPPYACNKEISTDKTISTTDPPTAQALEETTTEIPLKCLKKSIYKGFEERLSKLTHLLKAARTSLASATFLDSLYRHHLINENHKAKDIIYNAVLYHTEKYRNGNWSKAALHRECSEFGNFGVHFFGKGISRVYSLTKKKFELKRCHECVLSVHLVVFDNELYACGRTCLNDANSKLFLFSGNVWTKVTELAGSRLFLLSYENTILVFNPDSKIISLINPKDSYKIEENFAALPDIGTFEYALLYDSQVLLFYAETVKGIEETAVHCLNLISKIWTRLDNLDGPAKHLISFQDDEIYYIIQRNGNVWSFLNTKDKLVLFSFIGKLWTSDRILHGAVLYNDEVLLFGDNSNNYPEDRIVEVSNFPYYLNYWGRNVPCSNFLPVKLAKKYLTKLDQ